MAERASHGSGFSPVLIRQVLQYVTTRLLISQDVGKMGFRQISLNIYIDVRSTAADPFETED